ncbi:hypothetical protein RclHR1_04880007 [Rhizophagus clarus]|uniref:Kinase-like domain-containing protein n=1 Tax=Rhizophagus clarus TaxID=94130 RepID=A0A2Z6S2C4_9GLOM|nr:hypothetical protein RclHR1_04880007 [Rhizophagus clarus]GES92939.1 kinase-like domain-containing protein [Rhizophagus clarus]
MDQSNNISLTNQKRNISKPKLKYKYHECNGCNRRRRYYNEVQQICRLCSRAKTIPLSGNKVVDDFVLYTITNDSQGHGKKEYVPYNNFRDVKFTRLFVLKTQ